MFRSQQFNVYGIGRLSNIDDILSRLIYWPCRDSLQKTMILCFQKSFGKKVTIVIDCFKIFLKDLPTSKPVQQHDRILSTTTLSQY